MAQFTPPRLAQFAPPGVAHFTPLGVVQFGAHFSHQQMMVYSYAMCLGAINLRLFMTILMFIIDDYNAVYKIIAWMSWIPNLGIAYLINQQNFSKKPSPIFSSEVAS